MGRLTLSESFRCVRLVLRDERRKKLVSFGELRCGQRIYQSDVIRKSPPNNSANSRCIN
jgi:hypothetical protein